MVKQDILEDIDKLCSDIDKWTTERVKSDDFSNFANAVILGENLLVSAHQELSFLRDYIEGNVIEGGK